MIRKILIVAGFAASAILAFFSGLVFSDPPVADPRATATATLESLKRERRLVVMTARVWVPSTAIYSRTVAGVEVPGTKSRRTLIAPGTVHYAVDLDAIDGERDIVWDDANSRLVVRRPPVTILDPAVDLKRIQRFDESGFLSPFTDADRELDEITRTQLDKNLHAEARTTEYLRLAEEAADAALFRTFKMPLEAAGAADVQVMVERKAS